MGVKGIMKAIAYTKYGSSDVFHLKEVENDHKKGNVVIDIVEME